MQQVLVIHGGDAFASYEEYVNSLKTYEVDLSRSTSKGWKQMLQENLGGTYQVISPTMPNKWNAKYLEWKIIFEKYIPHLTDSVILVGHSLGGSFLAKYLSEETFPKSIKATFLIAPPYNKDEDRDLVEFTLPESLAKLENQGGKIFIYHSKDDPIVSFGELEKYEKNLPSANIKTFEDRGHFIQETFPEIIEDIKSC